jgi:hypothetical protein
MVAVKAVRMTKWLAGACVVVYSLTLMGCGRSGVLAPGAPDAPELPMPESPWAWTARIQFDLPLESAANPKPVRWELEWEGSWETTVGATVEGEVQILETKSFDRSELPDGEVPYLIWPATEGLQTGMWIFRIELRAYDEAGTPVDLPLTNIPSCNVELLAFRTTIVHLLESLTECNGNSTWSSEPETPNMP